MLFWKMIATGFGSGYSPVAPGTAGALVGCAIYAACFVFLPYPYHGKETLWVLILVFGCLGVAASNAVEKEWGHDASKIVVDEMVGMWIATLGVYNSSKFIFWWSLAVAFGLFRLFDIWKPFGIRRLEKLPGGWGVMLDDVAAGVLAGIVTYGLSFMYVIYAWGKAMEND